VISIAIASRNGDDRKRISALLAEHNDFRIISTGADGYDAFMSAKNHQPDIIIMDFSLRDIDSPELAPLIKRKSPSTALIVLCSPGDTVAHAFKAGISGYLFRHEEFDNLALSVRSVFQGGLYISKQIKSYALNHFPGVAGVFSGESSVFRYSFTPTETGVFCGISGGHSDREIAETLNISIGSVRNCVNRVKKKTGLKNRTQISVNALLAGIISIGKITQPRPTGAFTV
jgi:DNA-binding NarL/FixJ family response regulator